MKVLHVTDHYTPRGGVEQYILSVARLLAENGHSNAILYTQESVHTIRNGEWPAHHLCMDCDMDARLVQILRTERADIAYIHQVASPTLIEILVNRLPTVAFVHGFLACCPGLGKYFRRGDLVCDRPFGVGCVPMHYFRHCSSARRPTTLARLMHNTAALKRALQKVPCLLAGSRYMADLLVQNGFAVNRISILPPHFLPDDIQLCYTPPTSSKSVLFAGRLEIEKGIPYLLKALDMLPTEVQLVIAGDGTEREHYEGLVRDLGLEGRVEFAGWLDEEELGRAVRRCCLMVIPSVFPEPFGKTGIDALVLGRPVIAFDVGGISDWLHHKQNGFLVEPGDTSALASRIAQLLEDEALCRQMGLAGYAGLVPRFGASRHLAILTAAYDAAIHAQA